MCISKLRTNNKIPKAKLKMFRKIVNLFKSKETDSFLTKRMIKHKILSGNVSIYKNSFIDFDITSRIIVKKGCFYFNEKWTKNDPYKSLLFLDKDAKIYVEDSFKIYSGSKVYVNKNAVLKLGSGYVNNNLNLSCFERIEIGNDVAISENVSIRDSDNHEIVTSSRKMTMPIIIGNHVWIGMNVVILKGVKIGDGAIIAAGSVVNRDIPSKCLAAGIPAKVIKTNVDWK